MKRCASQYSESVQACTHIHMHKPRCPHLQSQIPSDFIFCTWVEFMTISDYIVLGRRQCNARHQNSVKFIKTWYLFQLTCVFFLQ